MTDCLHGTERSPSRGLHWITGLRVALLWINWMIPDWDHSSLGWSFCMSLFFVDKDNPHTLELLEDGCVTYTPFPSPHYAHLHRGSPPIHCTTQHMKEGTQQPLQTHHQ